MAEWWDLNPRATNRTMDFESMRYDLFGTTPYFILLYNSSIPGRICQFSFVQNRRHFCEFGGGILAAIGSAAPGERLHRGRGYGKIKVV